MKTKRLFVILFVITSFFIPFALISFSAANLFPSALDIEWGVKEGRKYTWIVKKTNAGLGYLPVNSKYELTINSIERWPSGEEQQTQLIVNLTKYNSVTKVTTTILNNETFIYFDAATNSTSFYFPFLDHGFCMPTNYRDGFVEGLKDYFFASYHFNVVGEGTAYGVFHIYGAYTSTNLVYVWMFNSQLIVNEFVVADIYGDINNEDDFEYWLKLQVSDKESISYGNLFLIFAGLATFSIIYLYKKKEILN